MERTQEIDPDDAGPCPCCGVAISGLYLHEVGACEWCAGYPYNSAGSCAGKHGDELRLDVIQRADAGRLPPLLAMAMAALDDAHRAGMMLEVVRGSGRCWAIAAPMPDPDAWERVRRMRAVDRTIRDVVAMFVGDKASRPWAAADVRQVLTARLSWLSREAGCGGIWRIEVSSARSLDVSSPADYIDADTAAARIQATLDGLAREARVT